MSKRMLRLARFFAALSCVASALFVDLAWRYSDGYPRLLNIGIAACHALLACWWMSKARYWRRVVAIEKAEA